MLLTEISSGFDSLGNYMSLDMIVSLLVIGCAAAFVECFWLCLWLERKRVRVYEGSGVLEALLNS